MNRLLVCFVSVVSLHCAAPSEPVIVTGTSFTVGPAGGTLTVGEGDPLEGVVIEVPAGALRDTVTLRIVPTEDDTPLPPEGVRVGPQLALEPADLKLEAPVRITFPFAHDEWAQQATPAAKCRVWQRTDEGWEAHLAVTSGEETITIETTSTRPAAPGVLRISKVSTCVMFPQLCALPGACTSATGFCLEKLANPTPPPSASSSMEFMRGRLLYQHKVDATTQTLVEHAYPNGPARQSGPLTLPSFVFARGLASTADGALWGGFFSAGNIKLPMGAAPLRFDSMTGVKGNGMFPVLSTSNDVTRLSSVQTSSPSQRECRLVGPQGERTLPGRIRSFNCSVTSRPTVADSLIAATDNGLAFITTTTGSLSSPTLLAPTGFVLRAIATSYKSPAFAVTFSNADRTEFQLRIYANEPTATSTGSPVSYTFDFPDSDIEFGEDDRLYLANLGAPEIRVYDRAAGTEQIFLLSADPADQLRMRPMRIFNTRLENELLVATVGSAGQNELYAFKRAQ